MPRPPFRHLLACLLLGGAFFKPLTAGEVATEAQLTAAYLINFLKYVEWPAHPGPAILCLWGQNEVAPYLAPYDGRTVGGRELSIRKVLTVEQLHHCHLVYIAGASPTAVLSTLQRSEPHAILTVGDSADFLGKGGMIALIRTSGRLQFDLNAEAMQRAGLKPSPQMVRLARRKLGGEL